VLAVAAVIWVRGVPYWEARTHWRAAHEAAEGRDFAAARDHLDHCLRYWPDDPAVHFARARVLRRGGQPEAADEALGHAARLGHPPAEVELERALGRTQSGDVRAAETIPAAALGPEDDRLVREALVAGLLHGHSLDRAYRVTDKWVADRPDDWQGRLWHARVLEQGLQLELAADAYAEAVRLRPGNAEAERGLGEVLYRLGRYADAAPHFEAVLRANPADPAARLGLARAQRGYLPPAAAAETLRPLTEAPDPPAAVCLLAGQLALDQDRAEGAAGWLRRAVAAAPHDRDANLALAQALHRLGRADEATKFADTAEAIGRDHKRMEQITKAVAESPGDVELRYEAGVILSRLGQDAGAARWLVSALAINPGHRPTRDALAACADRLGDPRLAEYARRLQAAPGKE
jgi:tetratricopeptide (TPR) repeat protein